MMLMNETTNISFPNLGWGPWTFNKYLVEDLFGSLSIAWYGVIICFAMILAAAIILRYAVKKEGMNLDSFLDYFLFAIPLGVVGARTMYVLAEWEEYDSFAEMIAIWNGGIAIFGAIIAGILTILVLAKIKKQPALKVLDAFVPGVLIAQSLGRWGNFINGEAHGVENQKLLWGMMIDGKGPFHPNFFYESVFNFVGFLLVVLLVYRFKKEDGQVLSFYLVWYGLGRTLIESVRGEDVLLIGNTGLRLAQCIGILAALCGLLLFVLPMILKQGREEKKEKTEEIKEISEEKAETEEMPEEVKEEAGEEKKTEEGEE